jgi:hypothetical protein
LALWWQVADRFQDQEGVVWEASLAMEKYRMVSGSQRLDLQFQGHFAVVDGCQEAVQYATSAHRIVPKAWPLPSARSAPERRSFPWPIVGIAERDSREFAG